MLGTIRITVFRGIDGSTLSVRWVGHVVAFFVSPIHRKERLSANIGVISNIWVQIARRLVVASNRGNRLSNNTLGRVRDIALEGSHVHLVSTTDGVVNPKPCANALAHWTCREIRNVESLECSCGAILDYGHDNKILRSDITKIGLVGNTQGTACNISALGRMKVRRPLRARV